MKARWHERLEKVCSKLNIEYFLENPRSNKLIFYCAKSPSEEQKKEIRQILPSQFSDDFVTAPKIRTINILKTCLLQAGLLTGTIEVIGRKLLLDANCMLELNEESPLFNKIHEILKSDGYFDEWELKIGEIKHSFNLKLSETLSNNIKRDTVISEDDVTNLIITLNDPDTTWDKLMEVL